MKRLGEGLAFRGSEVAVDEYFSTEVTTNP